MIMAFISCDDQIEVSISKITLNRAQVSLLVGEEYDLIAKIEPAEVSDSELSWTTSDAEIATVENGKVTGISEGEAVITVTAPNGVKATCDVTVVAEDKKEEDMLEELTFEAYYTIAELVSYSNGLFKWSVTFEDETAYNNKTYFSYIDGKLLVLEIYSKENNYSKGMPMGDFEVIRMANDDADASVRIKLKDVKSNIEEYMTSGSMSISKEGANIKFVIDVKNNTSKCISEAVIDTENEDLYKISNSAYNSTIVGSINENSIFKSAVYYNGNYGPELYLGGEGIDISPNGVVEGSGAVAQIYRNIGWTSYPKSEYDLSGTFAISSVESGPNVIQSGSKGYGFLDGSWYYHQDEFYNQQNMAPLTSGQITIELNDSKDYIKVIIDSKDDAFPENNTVYVVYEGECMYFDPDDTGDFSACKAGFFGPFDYDSDLMNWMIQLQSEEYKNSYGREGQVYMFDLLSLADVRYSDGLTQGTYSFSNTLSPMSIQKSAIWNFSNYTYEASDVTEIVDGTLTVEAINDGSGRFNVYIDVVTAGGQSLKGAYKGGLTYENAATPPMQNRVFNPEDAEIRMTYMKEDEFGRSNWALEMTEATAKREMMQDANGLILSFDIFVEGGHTFEKGMPLGKFDMYTPEINANWGNEINGTGKFGISNNAFTLFHIVYQGDTGNARGWTDGSVTIDKNSNGDYIIEVDMVSQAENMSTGVVYRYTLKGDYEGSAILEDFMNPSGIYMRNVSKNTVTAKASQKFSKTGK